MNPLGAGTRPEIALLLSCSRVISLGIAKRSFLHLRSFKTLSERFQYFYDVVIPPSSVEFQILELPSSLFFLYSLFQPFRLLGKYSAGRLINSLLASEVSVTKEKVYGKSYAGFDTPTHP